MTVPQRRGVWIDREGNYHCCVWAPNARSVELKVTAPTEKLLPLDRAEGGYWVAHGDQIQPGTRYLFRIDGHLERPDPASRSQPDGVHAASEVVDERFAWTDINWRGRSLAEMVIYELHVGTFSEAGTFAGVIERLDELCELGVNTIEVMPIARFPGTRNWGYDGVFPYAAQNSYGGLVEFKRLVDECHRRGMSVLLDVVYNHLGPEGNYLADFGPYFNSRHRTPWGPAINYDGPHCHEVREYFLGNALEWITHCHVDGLRLDAVHAIHDESDCHFLRELAERAKVAAQELNRPVVLVAETNKNDPLIVTPTAQGGLGMDGQWPDDFSRSLQGLLTGEREGYYADFGSVEHFAKACREAFVLTGQHSQYRGRPHGQSAAHLPANRFVACVQNHDQVGNRAGSERLSQLVDFDSLKLAAAAVLLSPYVPLIFMGEEYGETAPFNYFIDHGDRGLCKAVHRGRIVEFIRHAWQHTPPHPKALRTFTASKLNPALRQSGHHAELWKYYQTLLKIRNQIPVIRESRRSHADVSCDNAAGTMLALRWNDRSEIALLLNFGRQNASVSLPQPRYGEEWRLIFNSAGDANEDVAPRSARLYLAELTS